MSSNNENTENLKSHSQEKRELRKKEVAQARKAAKTWTIVGYVCIAVVVVLIGWGIAALVGKQMDKVTASDDYSQGLESNGYISGVVASDKVSLPADYLNIEVPYSEVEFSDEDIQADIDSQLEKYKVVSDDTNLKVADGDKVDIAYVGRMDGEEFEGGSSDSYALTIGSGSFIDTFEEQLIGAAVGDQVIVNVTFPENYGNVDLQGKPAEFTVDINGIYVETEFTDDFVAENLSAYATTVDGYKTYLRETNERAKLEAYVESYLKDNSSVSSYPNKYVRILKSIKKYDDQQSYEYMNMIYLNYYGASVYNSFEDYIGMTEAEYDESLKDICKETCKENMIYQAIVEKSGEVIDRTWVENYMTEQGNDMNAFESAVQSAGEPFTLQTYIKTAAIKIVADGAKIVK